MHSSVFLPFWQSGFTPEVLGKFTGILGIVGMPFCLTLMAFIEVFLPLCFHQLGLLLPSLDLWSHNTASHLGHPI